jgi:putative transposase
VTDIAAEGVAALATGSGSTEETIGRLVDQAQAEGLSLTGPGGLLSELTRRVLESALEGELDGHLGYAKHDPAGRNSGNSRNGHRTKTVLTETGPVDVDVPRDRDSSFEPQIVAKRQSRLTGVDDLVISLSAKGLTHGEVAAHLAEVYGAEVSKQTITAITDRVVADMVEWQNRPLDPVYPVVFIDAIHVKYRDGQVANHPIYVALAVTVDGERDILGLWAGDGGEGAKYWLHVLTELRNRGVADVLILVCDGLKGLPDAVNQTWPQAVVQTCIVHLLRNSFRYASRKDWPAIARDLNRSTRPPPNRPPWTPSPTSPPNGRAATRPSCGSGRTPGPSSCPSWPSIARSAPSSAPPTPSRASTPGSGERSRPAATSSANKLHSSASTW